MPADVSANIVWTAGPAALIAAGIAAAVLSWYYYRRTLPPVSSRIRLLLFILRCTGLVLLVLLLFEPLLVLTRRMPGKARIAVLVDVSASMGLKGSGRAGPEQITAFFNSRAWDRFAAAHDPVVYAFSDSLRPLQPEGPRFNGSRTNIAGALDKALRGGAKKPEAILLISDGNVNAGRLQPAAAAEPGVPVYTAVSGDTGAVTDVIVSRVDVSRTGLAGHRIPVRAAVRGPGCGGRTVRVQLWAEGQLQDEQELVLPAGGFEKTAELFFQPDEPGFSQLSIRIPPLADEASERNNEGAGFVKISTGALKVLLLSAAPHHDSAFIRRVLGADPLIDVISRTFRSETAFYEGPWPGPEEIAGIDCCILADIPAARTGGEALKRILRLLNESDTGLFLIAGGQFDPRRLSGVMPLLPFTGPPLKTAPVSRQFRITGTGLAHPVCGFNSGEDEAGTHWEHMPPFVMSLRTGALKPQTMILAAADPLASGSGGPGEPGLLAGVYAGRKVLFLNGSGLYRWSMQKRDDRREAETFLLHTVRWLCAPASRGQFRLTLPERQRETGQEAVFNFTASDELFRPYTAGSAVLSLESKDRRIVRQMNRTGPGEYTLAVSGLAPGRWTAGADFSLDQNGSLLTGSDSTELLVEPFRAELQHLRPRPGLLQSLSRSTGGTSVSFADLEGLADTLRIAPRAAAAVTETGLNRELFLMALIIALFSGEWLIRKRKGMV